MPLTERDPNVSGRNSRASATSSACTRDSVRRNGRYHDDALSTVPGVTSMLRTTTEIGDVGSLALPLPSNQFGESLQRKSARTSASSTHSGASRIPRSVHRAWPSVSSAPRRSITSNLSVPEQQVYRPIGVRDGPLAMPVALHPVKDGRSFSMTNDIKPPPAAVTYHRSMTSLRTHEPLARPRSPFAYPTRLKRLGYRPPSPALSDITGLPPSKRPSGLPLSVHRATFLPPQDHTNDLPHTPRFDVRNAAIPSKVGHIEPIHDHRLLEPSPRLREMSASAPPGIAPAPLQVHRPLQRNIYSPVFRPMYPRGDPTSSDPLDPTGSSIDAMAGHTSSTDPSSIYQTVPPKIIPDDGPLYYDYSEQFNASRDHATSSPVPLPIRSPASVPSGFVHRIRTLLEEKVGDGIPTANSTTFTPVGVVPELAADRAIVELPAGDVPEAIRRMRQAQAAHASIHAENTALESIAHLISDGNEAEECGDPCSDNVEPPRSTVDSSEVHGKPRSKRLSVISEAASHSTKSTTNSAAIELAVQYSTTVSTPPPQSRIRTLPLENVAAPDGTDGGRGRQSREFAEEDQDQSCGHSAMFNGEEGSTGSIKVATEVILERKHEALSLLESRHTVDSPSSPNVLTSSPHPFVPYSPLHQGTAWLSGDSDGDSSDATPTDIAIRLSIPDLIPRSHSTKTLVPQTEPDTTVELQVSTSAATKLPVLVTVTESTQTISTVIPVSPLIDSSGIGHRDSPVSPVSAKAFREVPTTVNSKVSIDCDDSTKKEPKNTNKAPQSFDKPPRPNEKDNVEDASKSPINSSAEQREMSTTDLRFSQLQSATGSHRLYSDVREVPDARASTAGLQISSFKFPRPGCGRRTSLDSANEHLSNVSLRSGKGSLIARPYSDALVEIRSIPSLQFSSVNLIDKLNNALGHQPSTRILQQQETNYSSGMKQSLVDIRERYRSFFASLDDLNSDAQAARRRTQRTDIDDPHVFPADGLEAAPDETETEDPESEHVDKSDRPQRPTINMIQRPLSPQDIIDEVNRLTLPNIKGLTQRLSDIIPSLKRFQIDEDITEDRNFELTLDEIRGLGRRRIVRADGRVISLVKNEHWISQEHTGLASDSEQKSTEVTELNLPVSNNDSQGESSIAAGGILEATSKDQPKDRLAVHEHVINEAIQSMAPAVTRARSLTDSYGVVRTSSNGQAYDRTLHKPDLPIGLSRSSSFEIRPWNSEMSYPWAQTNIDVSFPAPIFQRNVPRAGPSKLRNDQNHAHDNGSGDDTSIKEDADEHDSLVGDDTRTTEDTFNGQRHRTRRSHAGSVTRRIGNALSSHSNKGNPNINKSNATSPSNVDNSGFLPRSGALKIREDERAVDVGDRYPTTGLSPPNAFNLDEVRSFFSDDSSIREGVSKDGLKIGKRLTKLRMGMTRAASAMDGRYLQPDTVFGTDGSLSSSIRRADGVRSATSTRINRHRQFRTGGVSRQAVGASSVADGTVSPSLITDYDGSSVHGMGKTEFRARKVIERLKVLWYRSGELIRTLSGKTRKDSDDVQQKPRLVGTERRLGLGDTQVYPGT